VERGFCEVSERCRSVSTYYGGSIVIFELAHDHFDLGSISHEQSTTTSEPVGATTSEPVDEPQPLHRPNSSSCVPPFHPHHPPKTSPAQITFQRLLALEKPVKLIEGEQAITFCRGTL